MRLVDITRHVSYDKVNAMKHERDQVSTTWKFEILYKECRFQKSGRIHRNETQRKQRG